MQTFLPYSDYKLSLSVLDYRRAGKQRLEAKQIYDILMGKKSKYYNHACIRMWRGYSNALAEYYNVALQEWAKRGYKNIKLKPIEIIGKTIYPKWLGREDFHSAYRSALLAKKFDFYKQYGWKEKAEINYSWG